MILTGHAIFVGDPLGRIAHRPVLEGAGQAVVGHVVLHGRGAVLHTTANVGEVGGEIHVLHAAGNGDVDVAGFDRPSGLHHGLEARTANLVDGDRRDGVGDAGLEGRLSGGVLAYAGLQDAAHKHFVNVPGLKASVGDGRLDGSGTQFGGGDSAKASEELPNRGTAGGEDDGSGGVAHAKFRS